MRGCERGGRREIFLGRMGCWWASSAVIFVTRLRRAFRWMFFGWRQFLSVMAPCARLLTFSLVVWQGLFEKSKTMARFSTASRLHAGQDLGNRLFDLSLPVVTANNIVCIDGPHLLGAQ